MRFMYGLPQKYEYPPAGENQGSQSNSTFSDWETLGGFPLLWEKIPVLLRGREKTEDRCSGNSRIILGVFQSTG